MGIYIPGMKMPKEGKVLLIDPWGNVRLYWSKDVVAVGTGLHLCKASELHPNGDLIERGALCKSLDRLCDRVCQYSKAQRKVMCSSCPLGDAFAVVEDDAPTIIPAEEGEI